MVVTDEFYTERSLDTKGYGITCNRKTVKPTVKRYKAANVCRHTVSVASGVGVKFLKVGKH